MRYVIGRANEHKKSNNVEKILQYEKKNKIDSFEGCLSFKKKCLKSKFLLKEKINKIKSMDKKIVGYGATSKSTTILNYCGINSKHIDCIFDTTKEKNWKIYPRDSYPYSKYE